MLRELAEVREQAGDWSGRLGLEEEATGPRAVRGGAPLPDARPMVGGPARPARPRRALLRRPSAGAGAGRGAPAAVACAEALGRYGHAKRLLDAWRDAGGDRAELARDYAQLGASSSTSRSSTGRARGHGGGDAARPRRARGGGHARALRSASRTWRDQAATLEERAAVERIGGGRPHLAADRGLHVAYDPDGSSMAREAFDRAGWPRPAIREPWTSWNAGTGSGPTGGAARGAHPARAQLRDLAAAVAANLRLSQVLLVRFGDADGAREASPAPWSSTRPTTRPRSTSSSRTWTPDASPTPSRLERHLAARRSGRAPRAPAPGAEMAIAAGSRPGPGACWRLPCGRLGIRPAARALLRSSSRGRLAAARGDAPGVAAQERDPVVRASLLQRAAEVALEPIGDTAERCASSPGTRHRAGAHGDAAAARGVAARTGDYAELSRAFTSGAAAAGSDLGTRKALLRRVAEIEEHDLGRDERRHGPGASSQTRPDDRGAANAYEAAGARRTSRRAHRGPG